MGNNKINIIRHIFSVVLFFCIPILTVSAGDRSEMWKKMYNRVDTIDQQYAIMQNIVAMDDPALIEMLDSALAGQISTLTDRLSRTGMEKKNLLMRMIVAELSSLRAEESAGTIFTLYNSVDDRFIRAECLLALGQIRAVEFVPQISTILRNLNFNTSADKDAAEIVAYAAIISLERMKENIGFEQVFYASLGWYNRRVKERASAALSVISDDPTEPILNILSGDSDYVSKERALVVENNSQASSENKNRVATLGLSEGLRYSPNDKIEEYQLSKLRLSSMNILITNQYKGSDVFNNLGIVFENADDINEKLLALQALGVNGSDQAVLWLSNKLSEFNTRQLDGLAANQTELIYVKQLINSLAVSGNVNAKPVLLEVQFSNYTPAINRLSKNAIKELE